MILIPLALGVALYFFLRYRRQQRDHDIKLHELQAEHSFTRGQPIKVADQKELPVQYGTELYTAQHRVEMPHHNPAVELDAGARSEIPKKEKVEWS